jgi:hypothetical protein
MEAWGGATGIWWRNWRDRNHPDGLGIGRRIILIDVH